MKAKIMKTYFHIYAVKRAKAGGGHLFEITSSHLVLRKSKKSALKHLHRLVDQNRRTTKVLFCLTSVLLCPLRQRLSGSTTSFTVAFPPAATKYAILTGKHVIKQEAQFLFKLLYYKNLFFLYTHTSMSNNDSVTHQLQKKSYS